MVRAGSQRAPMLAGATDVFTWEIQKNEVRRLRGIARTLEATGDRPVTLEALLTKIHPDDRDQFERRVRQAVERPAEEYHNDYRMVDADGCVRRLQDIGRIEVDANGKPLRLVGLTTDLTERSHRVMLDCPDGRQIPVMVSVAPTHEPAGAIIGVRALRETAIPMTDAASERSHPTRAPDDAELDRDGDAARIERARLETALDSSQVVLFHQNRELHYTWIHSAPSGHAATDRVGGRDSELLQRAYELDQVETLKRSVLQTGIARREEVSVSDEGENHCFDLVILPDFDAGGEIVGVNCAAIDVTNRKRAEDSLRIAGDSFRQLVEQSPFGVYAVDADFRLVMVSAGAQKVFSNVRPLLGRDFGEVMHCLWSEPFLGDVLDRFRHTLATGETFRKSSTVEQRADTGATEAYDWQLDRVVLPDGRPGVVCHFYDLSERQRYEAALREADRKKDEFLATLAHELRNPMAPIRSGLEIMKLPGTDARTVERVREIMERQLVQLTRLVNDLLDVSRIGQGKIVMHRARMNLAEAVRNAVDSVQPLIEVRGHEFRVDLPAEPIHVEGDLARLSQVFANLLDNAAKYTPRGGRIRLSITRQGDAAKVSVADNGVGIPAEMLESVFEMFTQVDRSTRSHSGLGIGLNIVKRLVDAHGGSVAVTSDGPGSGSTFVIRLPLVASPIGDPSPLDGDQPEPAPRGRRILVVDDNRDAADALTMMLSIMGNVTRTARDGLQAVDIAAEFRPDVILMDIGMPKLDGYDACRRIRQETWGKEIVMVAQTGWGGARDKQQAEDAGFDFHLTKPVDPDALAQLLSED